MNNEQKEIVKQLDATIAELEVYLKTFKEDLEQIQVEKIELGSLLSLINSVNNEINSIKNNESPEEE